MSKPESGPEMPEELYANLVPGPFAPFVCYTSEAQAKVHGDLAGLETRLVGVNPDWRERAMKAEKMEATYRERCRAMIPSRHRQRHLREMLSARKEAAELRAEIHDLRNQLNAAAIEAAAMEGGHRMTNRTMIRRHQAAKDAGGVRDGGTGEGGCGEGDGGDGRRTGRGLVMKLFKVDSKRAIVRMVEGEPYPGKDQDGDTVYENTHFESEHDAWQRLREEVEGYVKLTADQIRSAMWELKTARTRSANATLRMAAYIENRNARSRAKGE